MRYPRPVQRLKTWDIDRFCQRAFQPQIAALLPCERAILPPAFSKWFDGGKALAPKYWNEYRDTIVPLELTSEAPGGQSTFEKYEAPLGIFLDWTSQSPASSRHRFYLAQCPVQDLPRGVRDDLPTPELVLQAGKGDLYDTNIWIGQAPTYTPLHRDPNHNLFMQLAGTKIVRLYRPRDGEIIFKNLQKKLGRDGSAVFRGDEMMMGEEKRMLEGAVWGNVDAQYEIFSATVQPGMALYIPLGWWHSIKSTGYGIPSSVNWWFR